MCPMSYVLQGGWRGREGSKGAKVREEVTLGKEELFQLVNREWKMNLEVKRYYKTFRIYFSYIIGFNPMNLM